VWSDCVGGGASGFAHSHHHRSAYRRCHPGSGISSVVRLKKLPGAAPEALFVSSSPSPFRFIRFLLQYLIEIFCNIDFGFVDN
jgi:hypothetical protein